MAKRTPDAYEKAVGALGRNERTVHQLREWLGQRDFGAEEIEDAITRLSETGALDDERYAREFTAGKRELRGWGDERIRETLEGRGVGRPEVEAALAQGDGQTELERASGLLAREGRELGTDAERSRALAFLTRRGYAFETAYDAIRQAARR